MLKHKYAQKYTIEFIMIGSGAALFFRTIYEMLFSDFNTLVFFFGFGFVGLVLGIYYSIRVKIYSISYLNYLVIPIAFMLCGIAFSTWLHIIFATNLLSGENLGTFGLFLLPGAVSSFVYIFCALYISLEHKIEAFNGSLSFSILIIFFILLSSSSLGEDISITTLIVIGLASYLIVLFVIYITILYLYSDYVGNMTFDGVLLIIALVLLPIIGAAGFLFFPLINLYFVIVLLKRFYKKKEAEIFKQKITISFEWLFALPSVFLNATLIFFPFSVIPYIGITNTLMKTKQLSHKNLIRVVVLGLSAFIVYISFYVAYSLVFFTIENLIIKIVEIIFWGFIGSIASAGLGYSLIFKGLDEKNNN